MSSDDSEDRTSIRPAGDSGRKPTEVMLYQMPENLDEMSDDEIHELARRIWADFTASVKKDG